MERIVCKEIYDSLISYIGYTTTIGAVGGGTLICGALVNRPDYDGNQVVIISGPNRGQARDINGVTTAGVVTPNIPFAVQVTANTRFAIIGIRTTPAEIAALTALVVALMADVGDASTATLGSIFGILGDPATDLATDIATIIAALIIIDTEVGDLEGKLDLVVVPAVFAYLNAGLEQTAFTFTPATNVKLSSIWFDLATLTQNTTIRLKHQIDGANYATFQTFQWTTGMDNGVYFRGLALADARPLQASFQEVADEGADRDIPYYYAYESR